MTYALVIDDELVAVRHPGRLEPKLSDGYMIGAPDGVWDDDLAAACGFVRIVETAQPADTATTTHDRTVEMVDGAPTVVWVERPKTDAEMTPPDPDPLTALQAQVDTLTAALEALLGGSDV